MSSQSPSAVSADRALHRVAWLTAALFVSYLCVAMSLPVTSVYVTTRLGLGNALAGLAVGIAFASTILTRGMAGRIADRQGGKHCMIRGVWIYTLAGLVCAAASWPGFAAPAAYGLLVLGRLLLGWGESLATVGLIAWALGVTGPQRSGRVFALVGIGLYGAFAVGSPIGVALLDWAGFAGVMLACALVPLVGMVMVLPLAGVAPQGGQRPSFWSIIARIWQPGLVVGLQGVGFAAIGAFMALLFLSRGWPLAGLGLSCFGGAFVLVRLLFGHLPDRLGSIPVTLASIAVEATGQYLLWVAPSPVLALMGAFLTGLGCSLIFPAMGIEAVRRVPPHLRGTAAGGFAAFRTLPTVSPDRWREFWPTASVMPSCSWSAEWPQASVSRWWLPSQARTDVSRGKPFTKGPGPPPLSDGPAMGGTSPLVLGLEAPSRTLRSTATL